MGVGQVEAGCLIKIIARGFVEREGRKGNFEKCVRISASPLSV